MRRVALLAAAAALVLPAFLGGAATATDSPADDTPPVTHMLAPGADPSTIEEFPELSWRSDDDSAIAEYDIRVSRTPMRSKVRAPWTYPAPLQGATATKVRLHVRPGVTLCVQARARDAAGNVEPWRSGSWTCAVRALDDHALKHSGRIEVVSNRVFYNNGRARVLHQGAKMWLGGIPKGSWVGVLLTTLPNPDRTLDWRFPGTHGGTVGDGARVRHSRFVTLDNRATRDGRVVVEQPYNYRSLPLEGLTVIPRWVVNGHS